MNSAKVGIDVDCCSLNRLPVGTWGEVVDLCLQGFTYRRMLDLGLIRGTLVRPLWKNSAGSLTAYLIKGAVIALRANETRHILVAPKGKAV